MSAPAAAAAAPPDMSNPPAFIYKLVPSAVWADTFEKTGHYTGSEVDKKDGFIHISSKEEVSWRGHS